jgi:ferredoxin
MTRAHTPARGPAQVPNRTPSHAPSDTPRAETAAPASPFHLVVDLNRCQAYAQCCFMAPGVFRLHGEEALWYDPAPDESQREHVLRAAAACPVQAITVEWAAGPNRKKAKESHAHAAQRS